MSSSIYLAGYALVIVALGLGAYYLHVPTRWMVVALIVLLGMGLTGLAKSSRRRG